MSNFYIQINYIDDDGNQKQIMVPIVRGVIRVSQRASQDSSVMRLIVRPDYFLQSRMNIVSKSGVQLTNATVLQSDPVDDPNHWLKRDDNQIGYTKLKPASQAVKNRRHFTKNGRQNVKYGRKNGGNQDQ